MNNYLAKQIGSLFFLFFIISVLVLSSCIPQKKVRYVQPKDKEDTLNTFIVKHRPINKVQPFDNLYIKIISPDQSTSQMFNSETGGGGGAQANINYHMISYTVSDSGYIDFPFVGQIYVEGLTILEAKDVIQNALSQYISNVAIIVKFVGKSITILGEVMQQEEFVIYSNNLTIFKAFAMAGGLTDFGNRKNVTIIREEDGKANFYTVDLTDKRITSSEFYYLKSDDVLIVHPLGAKSWGFASFPYSLLLTSLTTLIVVLTFIRTAP